MPLPNVRSLSFLALVFSLTLFVFSCSNIPQDESGSVSVRLPSSSSRSVSSSSALNIPSGISTYTVAVRDSDNEEVQKEKGIAPGSVVVVDKLRAGKYTAAIRALDESANVIYYGCSTATVKPKEDTEVPITMYAPSQKYINLTLSNTAFQSSVSKIIITAKGKQNGDSYTQELSSLTGASAQALSGFYEPGIKYQITAQAYSSEGLMLYSGSTSVTPSSNVQQSETYSISLSLAGIYYSGPSGNSAIYTNIRTALSALLSENTGTGSYTLYVMSDITDTSSSSYTASQNYSLLNINPDSTLNLTITGGGTINAARSASRTGRVIYINSSVVLTLKNITIKGGYLLDADGYIDPSDGAGIRVGGGHLIVQDGCTITNNTTTANGGGIYRQDGKITIEGGSITNNKARSGGGIQAEVFASDTESISSFVMTGGTISGNTATYAGGGIDISGTALSISGGQITSNTAEWGGGIHIGATIGSPNGYQEYFYASLSFSNGTITGNTATENDNGSDIHIEHSECTYTNTGGTVAKLYQP